MMVSRQKNDIFIAQALRTPVASPFKGLKDFTAAQLASFCFAAIAARQPSAFKDVREIVLGNTVSAGTGQNLAREALVLCGQDVRTPAFLVNSVCGSGLEAVIMAVRAMKADGFDAVIAGGTESASHCPQIVKKNKEPQESLLCDGLWCNMSGKFMGELAENLASQYNISRLDQDKFSYQSHLKAVTAQAAGKFRNEIIPIRRADGTLLDVDERPRPKINLERMAVLPSAFLEGGTVTAGNASSPADGAAALLLVSSKAKTQKKYQLKPLAKILSYASIALSPEKCFEGAALAIRAALAQAKLTLRDIDLFEIGESFASQIVWTKRILRLPEERLNIYGGDIALGHPLGATAARMLVTLCHALVTEKKKRGVACVCFGSGGAVALVIERV